MAMDDETFQQVLDTVTRFARERLIPAENEVEQLDDIPEAIVQEMRDLGLFGLSIPEEYGGLELNVLQESQVVEALTYASMSFRSMIGTNVGIGAQGIVMEGTPKQKQQYLPGLASGELIASFALTEPDNGSDASHIRTSARRDGGDYVINGTKRYITNAVRANVFTLFARTNPDEPGAGGVSAFLLPAETPGIHIATPDRKMGQKGTKTSDVILEDVRIPAEYIVGGPQNEGKGFRTAMKVLDRGRIHVSSMAVGTAQRMLDEALGYSIERKQFGVPICEHQLVQGLLADSQAELAAARALVRDAARKYDETGAAVLEASCAKYFCTEMAGRVADRAVQVHGGAGYMAEYAIERLYRDARLLRIYEGTSQIQQIIIARNIVKAAKDRM
ncbi:acyl-CoA dehydrogenase family protein [Phaeobacter gallaeciensis]|uniref:acyl-CoA dehydrogenase family protein n=1 Tax=Phaeobacter gallaeciensis TaxID=60890 RepID=UPI00237F3CFF|nr:acyl-CoA dehydrogenase family protein [Phaeobacter gallaeciensis]MDE4305908.1 acyl-CoA dehydrogenase family protein [Phaeobacter gallaeciensis]MDE4310257.1 acyl-CoA dehydrogenase family protein [Phaeobacter gallaeciensis]MDE4314629.1 acyl-CoA dehydrogenase family protein [Phaeobacter gallaeciensis]MDE4319186.1 acyl-CoA dehydrogenase family protein [Phaeobacter gallaeciensis]MDE4323995.1 acyl-CoA dehydrogenase family protein [Phaeobacter gallaeciensis]